VSSTTFSSNTADEEGGGLYYLSKCASVSLLLYFYNCAFDSNLAEWGGGIASYVAQRGKLNYMTAHGTNWTRNGAKQRICCGT